MNCAPSLHAAVRFGGRAVLLVVVANPPAPAARPGLAGEEQQRAEGQRHRQGWEHGDLRNDKFLSWIKIAMHSLPNCTVSPQTYRRGGTFPPHPLFLISGLPRISNILIDHRSGCVDGPLPNDGRESRPLFVFTEPAARRNHTAAYPLTRKKETARCILGSLVSV